jgi:hypothetical protein
MIRRVFDPEVILAAARSPDVAQHLDEITEQAAADFFACPENLSFIDDETGACAVFEYIEKSIYEAHFLIQGRGPARLRALEDMAEEVFTTYGASGIYGYVSRNNRAARVVGRWIGGTSTGPHVDAAGRDQILFCLTRENYVVRTKKGCRRPATRD